MIGEEYHRRCSESRALDLMREYSKAVDMLEEEGVVRTRNNPVGDYAEFLASRRLQLSLDKNSKKGYDAIDRRNGNRIQIKGRQYGTKNWKELGVIRNLEKKSFDYIVAIIFERDFTVRSAFKIPYSLVKELARDSVHQNAKKLYLTDELISSGRIKPIPELLKAGKATRTGLRS